MQGTAVRKVVFAPMRSGPVKGVRDRPFLEGGGLAGFSCRRCGPGRSRGKLERPVGPTTLPPARTGPGSWDEQAPTGFGSWLACTHWGPGELGGGMTVRPDLG